MSKSIKKTGAAILAVLLTVWLWAGVCLSSVSAEGNGSIKMVCRVNNTNVSGMTWNIYKVGERAFTTGTAIVFQAFLPFDNYFVRISEITAEHLTDMASTLENMAIVDKVKPRDTQVSDANGELTFSGLEPGLYLLSGKYMKDGMYTYKASPSLVEITENGETVLVNAKIRRLMTLGDEITYHELRKIWENDNANVRPKSITAEIYFEGELVETVELSEANNWTYEWSTTEYGDWRVKEKEVPDQYTVIYRSNDENQYVIVNTYDETGENVVSKTTTTTTVVTTTTTTVTAIGGDDEDKTTTATSTTVGAGGVVTTTVTGSRETSTVKTTAKATTVPKTTTTETKLPQTGQLWWPVPVLGFGGTVFIAAGFRMRTKKQDSE